MAKKAAVKEKCEEKYAGHKGKMPGMEVKTPYPKEIKKSTGTSTGLPRDIQFLGEALVKETNRINELELSVESLHRDVKRIMGRMGL